MLSRHNYIFKATILWLPVLFLDSNHIPVSRRLGWTRGVCYPPIIPYHNFVTLVK